jgi:CheY-like chemotaxis protein
MVGKKKRILIIDDDIPYNDLVRLTLEGTGTGEYEVASEAHSGNAVETARAFQPDLILLDLIMPALTGCEVLRDLRQDPILCAVPIIVVSGIVSKLSTLGASLEHDGCSLIGKPVQLEQLVRCIDERLQVVAA